METGQAVVRVEHVSKDFVLPHEKVTSVKSAFLGVFNLNRTKEMQHALRDISFEIKKGEFFGIVGRNGSGKSTLLKILAGIYQPTKGTVYTSGRLVPFIELGVGFNPELTGRENVYLNGAMLGFSEKEVSAMYDAIVEFAELERFMDQKLKNYSSGMQVRLAFSMAIRAEAEILIIDEVLAVGDASFQRKCLEYFRKLKKNGTTVIFVSHDMDAVRQFCDRAVLIDNSRLVNAGNADDIAEKYAKLFLEESIGEAAKEARQELGDADRWGTRVGLLAGPFLSAQVMDERTKFIEFGAKVKADAAIEGLILGFRISDDTGRAIIGTNTQLLHEKPLSLESGSEYVFTWRVPNIFSNGNYEIGMAAVTYNDESLDEWNAAIKFKVIKTTKTPYIVAPDFKFDIKA